ncbi:hypothetical protein PFICI_08079 [Pestalotiopsis fici W106-1]|uniref:Uncharacterized protein n=1 Tax=Pestalotiopsis fici (strain W106-1 / CGMCC3.15140) TaxID=1229662 RepID=W3X393_PESFW|nr:uncharacterized protein PFICI_08079 [Pestalotiopsis fici W106-1]ETS80550.1 hypothetical protein PFICI_08079 [Pestalotiopsis fici W106-1]
MTDFSRPLGRPPSKRTGHINDNNLETSGDSPASAGQLHLSDREADSGGIEYLETAMSEDPFDAESLANFLSNESPLPPVHFDTASTPNGFDHFNGDILSLFNLLSKDFSTEWPEFEPTNKLDNAENLSNAFDEVTDIGIQISDIHLRISKQLVLVRQLPWDKETILKLRCSEGSNTFRQPHQIESVEEFDPMTSTMSLISEFTQLTKGLREPNKDDNRRFSSAQHLANPSRFMDNANLATMLSTNNKLLSIFEYILSRAISALSDAKRQNSTIPLRPLLSLGKYEVSPQIERSIVARLLSNLVSHEIGMLERTLGVPPDWAVIPQDFKDDYRGSAMLGGTRGETMLKAMNVEERDGTDSSDRKDCIVDLLRKRIHELGQMM